MTGLSGGRFFYGGYVEKERIIHFALDVLGCGCDHSVFNSIEEDEGVMLVCGVRLARRIVIGRRLMIYIVSAEVCPPAAVEAVIGEGMAERDGRGYNRLRLVIVSPDAAELRDVYAGAFSAVKVKDEKCHIHVVLPRDAV